MTGEVLLVEIVGNFITCIKYDTDGRYKWTIRRSGLHLRLSSMISGQVPISTTSEEEEEKNPWVLKTSHFRRNKKMYHIRQ